MLLDLLKQKRRPLRGVPEGNILCNSCLNQPARQFARNCPELNGLKSLKSEVAVNPPKRILCENLKLHTMTGESDALSIFTLKSYALENF